MLEIYSQWALYYCLIGLVLIPILRALVYIFHRKESPSAWVKEINEVLRKERTLKQKVTDSLSWMGLIALVAILWPIVLVFVVYYAVFGEPSPKTYASDGPHFKCSKKDLIKRVDPVAVETASYVTDPRNRVPNVPFGHLYQGWLNLLTELEPGDQLWLFKTKGWTPKESGPPRYSYPRNVDAGYAVVRKKKIIAEFICEWD